MYVHVIFGIICFELCALISNAEEFYWKEWNGTVPYDAVPSGIVDDKQTYIGSTLFLPHGLVSTTIYGNGVLKVDGYIGSSFLTATERTLILCAPLDAQPTWKAVHLHSMLSTGCKFIPGGFFDGVKTYIGRGKFGKNILLGKVFPYGHRYQGFEVWNGNPVERIKEFEALGFCWNNTPAIDVRSS